MSAWTAELIGRVLAILFVLALLVAAFIWWSIEDKRCEENGGVYLSREAKCVRGIEEIQ